MKQTRLIMGMPVTIKIVEPRGTKKTNSEFVAIKKDMKKVFDYFKQIDRQFSTYKKNSEISKINRREVLPNQYTNEMKKILQLCSKTKKETQGYFEILHKEKVDPSGLVKGYAISNASKMLLKMGYENHYVDAGGDIQISGSSDEAQKWTVGIRNPFNEAEIVKVVELGGKASNFKSIATSGTYVRGQHVYDPFSKDLSTLTDIVSLSVLAHDIYDADRFATAAFAMQRQGINFIEQLQGFEGYMIDSQGIATMTDGFEVYVVVDDSQALDVHPKILN